MSLHDQLEAKIEAGIDEVLDAVGFATAIRLLGVPAAEVPTLRKLFSAVAIKSSTITMQFFPAPEINGKN